MWACFSLLVFASGVLSVRVHASQRLPTIPASLKNSTLLLKDPKTWYAQIGNSIVYNTDEVQKYFYAIGSYNAIPAHLKDRVVASDGKYHVFHLPEAHSGSISLTSTVVNKSNTRSQSISVLKPVQHQMVKLHRFADYAAVRADALDKYVNPLADFADFEKTCAKSITQDLVKGYLGNIVLIGNGDYSSRAFDDPVASKAAVNYLKAEFTKMNHYTVCEHNFPSGGTNVVAFLRGQTADAVIVGAHYDSRPYYSEHKPAPGAVDNGSGTAGVLSIAWVFAEHKVKPVKSVYFVLFGMEEEGMLGSEAFVKQLQANPSGLCPGVSMEPVGELEGGGLRMQASGRAPRKTAGIAPVYTAIIMDEVGWKTGNLQDFPRLTVNLETSSESYDVTDHLYKAATDLEIPMDIIHSDHPFGSDHCSFLQHLIHAVLTIHGDDEAYSGHGYHNSDDTIDKLHWPLMANIVMMNFAGALRLAGVVSA